MIKNKQFFLRLLRVALPLLLTLLWLGFIYGNSLKSGTESSEQSGKVQEIVNEVADSVGIEEPISERFIRKAAHFTEFAVLGILVCIDLWALGAVSLTKRLSFCAPMLLCSVPICFLFASADEILQNFSESRGPSFTDVLIDTSGAAAATLIFIALFVFSYLTYKKHTQKKHGVLYTQNDR